LPGLAAARTFAPKLRRQPWTTTASCGAARCGILLLARQPSVPGRLRWYVDLGKISLYFASTKLLPAKTRAFVDYVTKSLRSQRTAKRYCAT
jgi:hypothetical protein